MKNHLDLLKTLCGVNSYPDIYSVLQKALVPSSHLSPLTSSSSPLLILPHIPLSCLNYINLQAGYQQLLTTNDSLQYEVTSCKRKTKKLYGNFFALLILLFLGFFLFLYFFFSLFLFFFFENLSVFLFFFFFCSVKTSSNYFNS
jgi:hypothetical protein